MGNLSGVLRPQKNVSLLSWHLPYYSIKYWIWKKNLMFVHSLIDTIFNEQKNNLRNLKIFGHQEILCKDMIYIRFCIWNNLITQRKTLPSRLYIILSYYDLLSRLYSISYCNIEGCISGHIVVSRWYIISYCNMQGCILYHIVICTLTYQPVYRC